MIVLYLSLVFGKDNVQKVLNEMLCDDSQLSLKLKRDEEKIKNTIKSFRTKSISEIKEIFNQLSSNKKEILIYYILKNSLLDSLSYFDVKINNLKDYVFRG